MMQKLGAMTITYNPKDGYLYIIIRGPQVFIKEVCPPDINLEELISFLHTHLKAFAVYEHL